MRTMLVHHNSYGIGKNPQEDFQVIYLILKTYFKRSCIVNDIIFLMH